MEKLNNKLAKNSYKWLKSKNGLNILKPDNYCETRDIFIARLDSLRLRLEKKLKNIDTVSLLVAITGEIGNNSFDHNIGAWRDIPGIYFSYDLEQEIIVLADRGQGVKKTIRKIKPNIKDDLEALKIAFTEIISGRSPEQRGNGLKFVVEIIKNNNFELYFHSGKATTEIHTPDYKLNFDKNDKNIKGTIAIISY